MRITFKHSFQKDLKKASGSLLIETFNHPNDCRIHRWYVGGAIVV